jgi:hypothetical protein
MPALEQSKDIMPPTTARGSIPIATQPRDSLVKMPPGTPTPPTRAAPPQRTGTRTRPADSIHTITLPLALPRVLLTKGPLVRTMPTAPRLRLCPGRHMVPRQAQGPLAAQTPTTTLRPELPRVLPVPPLPTTPGTPELVTRRGLPKQLIQLVPRAVLSLPLIIFCLLVLRPG